MTTPTTQIKPGDFVRLTGASWEEKGLLGTERHVAGDDHFASPGLPFITTGGGSIFFIHSATEHNCTCDFSAEKIEVTA